MAMVELLLLISVWTAQSFLMVGCSCYNGTDDNGDGNGSIHSC